MRIGFQIVTALLLTATAAAAQRPDPSAQQADVLAAYRGWWRAFTTGNPESTERLSSPALSVTLSTAETYDQAGAMRLAAEPRDSSRIRMEWSDESVRILGDAAIVTSRMAERVGEVESRYRFLTTMERSPAGWRVAAAQSTRILSPAPSVALDVHRLREFEGLYRIPSGAVLRLAVRDSGLALTTPDGREQIVAPVGDAVFELRTSRARFDLVRFVFERDASGRVVRLTRLSPGGVVGFPRVEADPDAAIELSTEPGLPIGLAPETREPTFIPPPGVPP